MPCTEGVSFPFPTNTRLQHLHRSQLRIHGVDANGVTLVFLEFIRWKSEVVALRVSDILLVYRFIHRNLHSIQAI